MTTITAFPAMAGPSNRLSKKTTGLAARLTTSATSMPSSNVGRCITHSPYVPCSHAMGSPGYAPLHGAGYVPGLPLCFKPLADEVPGQSLITRIETEIDVVVDLPCCTPHFLLLCGQPLQRRVQRSKGLHLVLQGLLHVPYGLFHDFLRVFKAINEAM